MNGQIDIAGAIRYCQKALPGQRLALHAVKNQYGKKDLVVEGQMFRSYSVQGDKLTDWKDYNGVLDALPPLVK